jgi:hypothetical protein
MSAEKVSSLRPFVQEMGKRFFAASAVLREALLLETRIQATLQERGNTCYRLLNDKITWFSP